MIKKIIPKLPKTNRASLPLEYWDTPHRRHLRSVVGDHDPWRRIRIAAEEGLLNPELISDDINRLLANDTPTNRDTVPEEDLPN